MTEKEILEEMYRKADQFKEAMQNGKYTIARGKFHAAMVMAKFVEMNQEELLKIFGEGGAFPPEQVRKAYKEKTC